MVNAQLEFLRTCALFSYAAHLHKIHICDYCVLICLKYLKLMRMKFQTMLNTSQLRNRDMLNCRNNNNNNNNWRRSAVVLFIIKKLIKLFVEHNEWNLIIPYSRVTHSILCIYTYMIFGTNNNLKTIHAIVVTWLHNCFLSFHCKQRMFTS